MSTPEWSAFMKRYEDVSVRYGLDGLSVARQDGTLNVDVNRVWLDKDGFIEDTPLDLRVILRGDDSAKNRSIWQIDPYDNSVEKLQDDLPETFDAVRNQALFGIQAIRAYLKLPPQNQPLAAGAIVSDRESMLWNYMRKNPHGSPEMGGPLPEELAIFEGTLRTATLTNDLSNNGA